MNFGIVKRLKKLSGSFLNLRAVFAIDLVLSLFASVITCFAVSLVSSAGTYRLMAVLVWMVSALLGSIAMYLFTGTYKLVIRHSTVKDMLLFAEASLGKGLICGILMYLFGNVLDLYSVSPYMPLAMLLDATVTFFVLAFFRAVIIAAYQLFNSRVVHATRKVLVYGTGTKSAALVKRLEKSTHYCIVGYLSSTSGNTGFKVCGLPVYHVEDMKSLGSLREDCGIFAILFARNEDLQKEKDNLVALASKLGMSILMAPGIDEIVGGKVTQSQIRQVNIEDLLGREEIGISLGDIKDYFCNKTVMVTGAAGSIGSELCRQLVRFNVRKLVLFDNAETPMHNLRLELEDKYPELDFVPIIGDVRSPARVDYAFRKCKPQVVFHAAAYKHVPLMEENPCEAVAVNVCGSRTIAEKCIEYGVEKMVMISTDKAVNPTNIMGCSKRLAEIYVQSLGLSVQNGKKEGNTRFVTTRFGNVLGSNGSVIPRFRDQILRGGPVTVTHPDITRFFMTIPEACRLVLEAATQSNGNDIFVFDMGESVRIDDMARRMISLAGFVPDEDIKIEYTGLRPGEKLYEEVLATTENTTPSFHDRIRVAHVRSYDYEKVLPVFDELAKLSSEVRIPEMVRLMKKTVPEFKSKNSVYETYDN